jgi:hypothetical protein
VDNVVGFGTRDDDGLRVGAGFETPAVPELFGYRRIEPVGPLIPR